MYQDMFAQLLTTIFELNSLVCDVPVCQSFEAVLHDLKWSAKPMRLTK